MGRIDLPVTEWTIRASPVLTKRYVTASLLISRLQAIRAAGATTSFSKSMDAREDDFRVATWKIALRRRVHAKPT
jgi:hypothetical protein